jgi:hypothetical protein
VKTGASRVKGVRPVARTSASSTQPSELEVSAGRASGHREVVASRPPVVARSGWTSGRATSVVAGALLLLLAAAFLSGAGMALWANDTHRDAAGYLATGVHRFSTPGAALVTEPIELGSAGTGWLYSPAMLGEVRIRVAPANAASSLFVGIGPTPDVDRYLDGVRRTIISDFWTDRAEAIGGHLPTAAPGSQDFWVSSTSGAGDRTLSWKPTRGSWTVVVMNADARAGIDVAADLRARMSVLSSIAVGLLAAGALFGAAGALLIVGAIRRVRGARTV